MKFFVYENWTHDKAIIHRAECGFCNNGDGIHKSLDYSEKNGHWLKPFTTYEEAKAAAVNTKRTRVDNCHFCFRNAKSA